MNMVRWILAILLAVFFVFMGSFKFGETNPIFSLIALNSGISFFEPYARIATGVLEILTGLLLVIPRTRLLGALLGFSILAGALVFHFSPWLGIDVPGEGTTIFYMALVGMVLNIVVLVIEKSARTLPEASTSD